MKISTGRGWLAVVVLTLGTANGNQDHVQFTTGFISEGGSNRAILEYSVYPGASLSRTFGWISDVVVDEIALWKFEIGVSGTDSQLASAKSKGDSSSNQSQPSSLTDSVPLTATGFLSQQATTTTDPPKRRGLQINGGDPLSGERLQVNSNKAGGQVTITDVSWINVYTPLFFEARWNNGSSYSRAFTFVRAGEPLPVYDVYTNPSPHHNETGTPASNNGQISSSTGPAPQAPSGSPGQESTPTGNGLSSGAVIGIAVACGVVGLLLVFALVWYLLRRRQQKKAMGGRPVDSAYGSGNRRADELMAEKEAAADVDVAPHSPYSDEGGSGSAAGPSGGVYQDGSGSGAAHGEAVAAGAVAAGAGAAVAGSFTPYSDRPGAAAPSVAAGTPSLHAASVVQTDEPHVSVPSATPGRATPRALTTPYAHLVEEGMTEEEIRRLEEEERQLDAAIEQAGRR